jgi:Arc/MetJ-type ribon-helix-helix transcriptional regulator
LQQIVQRELALGSYASEDDLLMAAVRLLHQREEDLRNFKARLQGRLDQLDQGNGIEIADELALRAFFGDVQSAGKRRCAAQAANQ